MRSECILFSFHHIHISFLFRILQSKSTTTLLHLCSHIFLRLLHPFPSTTHLLGSSNLLYCDMLYRVLVCARPLSLSSNIYPSPLLLSLSLSLSLLFLLSSSFSCYLSLKMKMNSWLYFSLWMDAHEKQTPSFCG